MIFRAWCVFLNHSKKFRLTAEVQTNGFRIIGYVEWSGEGWVEKVVGRTSSSYILGCGVLIVTFPCWFLFDLLSFYLSLFSYFPGGSLKKNGDVWKVRISRPEVLLGKGVLKTCSKFTREHPCQSAISIKLQSNFIEIAIRHGFSPVNLLHIFRTPFYKNTSGWLLLKGDSYWNLN